MPFTLTENFNFTTFRNFIEIETEEITLSNLTKRLNECGNVVDISFRYGRTHQFRFYAYAFEEGCSNSTKDKDFCFVLVVGPSFLHNKRYVCMPKKLYFSALFKISSFI